MIKNFFRKDLNLKNRWWHRLLVVIFFFVFLLGIYTMYIELFSNNSPYFPQWKVVATLEERLTADARQVRDLKKVGERAVPRDSWYTLNSPDGDSLHTDLYCSNDLENRITEIQNKTGISNLYIRSVYDRKDIPLETFINYVRENKIKCLIPDAYTYSEDMRVTFLEPLNSGSLYSDDIVFYEKSDLLTMWYVVKMCLLLISVFIVITLIYYKVFLYIIFGNKK